MSAENESFDNNANNLEVSDGSLAALEEQIGLLREPAMDRVLSEAYSANELLTTIPNSLQHRQEIVAEFDRKWGEWLGEKLKVRGLIEYRDGKGQRSQAILWDTTVISNGFNAVTTSAIKDDRSYSELLHDFVVPADCVPNPPEGEQYVRATGKLTDVIVDTDKASKERAFNWVTLQYPLFVDEIDRRLLGVMSETEALEAVADLDIEQWIDLSDPLSRNCVKEYLRGLIVLDKDMPYEAVIEGPIIRKDKKMGHNICYEVTNMRAMTHLSNINLIPRMVDTNSISSSYQLVVKSRVYPMDHRQESMTYTVPLSSIKSIVSLRKAFYTVTSHRP
ncbi:hypothetical protein BGO18_02735 [Candidatus Saccharibacteria bacterium 47-87]|jgi:hypothetical protein|nr:hypothetical protein [Candidatus Saccharibacteria bacterium]OJU97069.1 MAG: hypothetical protein BGO18_02735 [Candidatus Saccharibacteria bacterium 47-87]